jgi:hypothetical protein
MKAAKATAIGAVVGLLMLIPAANRSAEHWLDSHDVVGLPYRVVHYPAIAAVFWWGRVGLPHPAGEWGELKLLPYAIVAEWIVLGAIAGVVLSIRSKTKAPNRTSDGIRQPAAGLPKPSR